MTTRHLLPSSPTLVVASLLALLSGSFTVLAGPLQQAEIHKIVNDVRVVNPKNASAQVAKVNDLIKDDLAVRTGIQSRAELLFQDKTLARLGAEALFSFKAGTRDMTLGRGTMLLQVPKGLGGARIHTAAVTAAITGTTIMVENLPGAHVKVVVLEGSLRLSINGRLGESVVLTPGKMIILGAKETRMPKPVSVDLAKLVKTSSLIDPEKFRGGTKIKVEPLPSIALIETEAAIQSGSKEKAQLAETNLLIEGDGTKIVMASKATMAALDRTMRGEGDSALLTTLDDRSRSAAITEPLAHNELATNTSSSGSSGSQSGTSGNSTAGGSTAVPSAPAPVVPPVVPVVPPVVPVVPVVPPVVDPFAALTAVAPPAVDSSAWTLSQARFSWPDIALQAGPNPVTPTNPLPISRPSHVINAPTVITTGGSNPTLVTGGSSNIGTIYGGAAVDGLASAFLFGSSLDEDAQLRFDTRFASNYSGTTPPNGVAVFKFADLTINGAPTVSITGGRTDIALVGTSGVNPGGAGGIWDLSPLRSLFIGTENGSLNLNNLMNFSATNGSSFETLHLYSRNGNTTLEGSYQMPSKRLVIDSTDDVLLSASSAVNVGEFFVHGIKSVNLGGSITAQFAQVWSDGDLTVNGPVTATTLYTKSDKIELTGGSITGQNLSFETASDFKTGAAGTVIRANQALDVKSGGAVTLNTASSATTRFDIANTQTLRIEAKKLIVPQSIALPVGTTGILQGGAEGVQAGGVDLTGFEHIASNGGDIDVRNLDSRYVSTTSGKLTVTGNLSTLNASVDGDIKVTGTINQRAGTAFNTVHILSGKSIAAAGGLSFKGTDAGPILSAPTGGGHLVLNSTYSELKFEASSIGGANFDGGSAASLFNLTEGGDGGILHVGTDAQPTAGKVTVNAPISATTGANAPLVAHGGKGGTIKIVSSDTIDIQSTVKVSASTGGAKSRQGGNIRLDSRRTSGTAINVTNSGQLHSLLSAAAPGPGGVIEFVSAGGDIMVDGGVIQADKGTIDIRNNGAGNIELKNAALRGDVVKANVLGANGQLIINGGTLDANTALKLYASGANGSVIFKENTSLNGTSVKTIAGNTVQIENGKVVTVNGATAAKVHTNNANYTGSGGNGSKTGSFGGRGATTSGFSSRPGY